jgi:hypothetical protein
MKRFLTYLKDVFINSNEQGVQATAKGIFVEIRR